MCNFNEIKGHEGAKRALEVALVGGHSVFIEGVQGIGKTMLLQAVESLGFDMECVDRVDRLEKAYRNCFIKKLETDSGAVCFTAPSCFCGNFKSAKNPCNCSVLQINLFQRGISRIAQLCHINMELSYPDEYQMSSRQGEDSSRIKERILQALELQKQRQGDTPNANLTPAQIEEFCQLDSASQALMKAAIRQLRLSPRQQMSVLKVARTTTDLGGLWRGKDTPVIEVTYLAEAVQYVRKSC